jgi:hypothetical protein
MSFSLEASILKYFGKLKDPRIERTKHHPLISIVAIAILAVICGADSWVAIETYACSKRDWLEQFLPLPNGTPSHDTFARVFARLDPKQLQQSFNSQEKKTFHASEQDTERVKKLRAEFWQMIQEINLVNLVFVDETGVNLAMTRLYARALIMPTCPNSFGDCYISLFT